MFPIFIPHSKSIFLGAALLLAASGSLCAQEVTEANETVTVDGTYTITKDDPSKLSLLRRGPQVSISRQVDYSDLDLGTHSGQYLLRDRVWMTAQDVCRQIAVRFPFDYLGDDYQCAHDAAAQAMTATKANIATNRASGSVRVGALQ